MPDPKGSILIVEDEESVRSSLSQVFGFLGYQTRSASNGIDAIIAMREKVPDLLLSDLNMPGMSGFELLSIVRRRFPAVRVIAMSGISSDDSVPSGVTADAFYQKGEGMAALLRVVQRQPWPSRQPSAAPAPIWMQKNGHDSSGVEFVTISCPECFRTFPQPISGSNSLILDTTCTHCRSVIVYAIVDPSNLTFPPPYTPAHRAETH